MDMRKPVLPKERVRTCEKVTLSRANDLAEYGERAAILAKSKGKAVDDWERYCPIMGDNNAEAWKVGWDREWQRLNTAREDTMKPER
jgi:hypothetical protein